MFWDGLTELDLKLALSGKGLLILHVIECPVFSARDRDFASIREGLCIADQVSKGNYLWARLTGEAFRQELHRCGFAVYSQEPYGCPSGMTPKNRPLAWLEGSFLY